MRSSAATRDRSNFRGGGADPKLLSALRRAEWERRTSEEKARHLASFIEAGQLHNKKNRGTRIEGVVRSILLDVGITGLEQNRQIGRFNVDFLVQDTIVECFGDFWHCNPRLWRPADYNRSLHMTAGEKWAKDALRRRSLEALGYRFVSFGEAEIRGDTDAVRSRLENMLLEKQE